MILSTVTKACTSQPVVEISRTEQVCGTSSGVSGKAPISVGVLSIGVVSVGAIPVGADSFQELLSMALKIGEERVR